MKKEKLDKKESVESFEEVLDSIFVANKKEYVMEYVTVNMESEGYVKLLRELVEQYSGELSFNFTEDRHPAPTKEINEKRVADLAAEYSGSVTLDYLEPDSVHYTVVIWTEILPNADKLVRIAKSLQATITFVTARRGLGENITISGDIRTI